MTQLRAEVASGAFKAVEDCTPDERSQALRINAEKAALVSLWAELLDELGEAWIPRTPFVMRMGAREVPGEISVAELRDEVAKLELALDMKRKGTGSNN